MTWRCLLCPAHGEAVDLLDAWVKTYWHHEDEHRER